MNYLKIHRSSLKGIKNKQKYLGMNLTKDMKDLYTEKNKTLIKEIERATNK